MALPEVTFSYYHDTWGGRMTEANFAVALPHAVAAVHRIIGFNVPDDTNTDAYERAVCMACDVDKAYGLTGGISEPGSASIGSFSYSAGANETNGAYDVDMRYGISSQLIGTGLLDQVVL